VNDLPDPRFLALLQAHRLLDANTVAQLRATQAQWAAQGRAVSLFQLAAHHRLLQPHVLQGLLQTSVQGHAQPPVEPKPEEPPDRKPQPKAPTRRPVSSRLSAGRTSQRSKGVGSRASQRAQPPTRGSLIHLYVGTAVIGGLIAILGWRLLSPSPDSQGVAEQPSAQHQPEPAPANAQRPEAHSVEAVGEEQLAAPSVERPREEAPAPAEPPEPEQPPVPSDAAQEDASPTPAAKPPEQPVDLVTAAAINEARAYRLQAFAAIKRNDAQQVVDNLVRAVQILEARAPEAPFRAAVLRDLAHTLWSVGSAKDRDVAIGSLVQFATSSQNPEVVSEALYLGTSHPRHPRGIWLLEKLLEQCGEALSDLDRARANATLAYGLLHDRPRRARTCLERAKALLSEVPQDQAPQTWYRVLVVECEFFASIGFLDEALERYEASTKLGPARFGEADQVAPLADRLRYTQLLIDKGDLAVARPIVAECLAKLRERAVYEPGQVEAHAEALAQLARLDTLAGDHRRALKLRLEVCELLRSVRSPKLGSATIDAGQSAWLMGDVLQAIRVWAPAIRMFDVRYPNFELARLVTLQGHCIALNGNQKVGLKRLRLALDQVVRYSSQLVGALTPAERVRGGQAAVHTLNSWLFTTRGMQPTAPAYEGVLQVRGFMARATEVLRRSYRRDPALKERVERLAAADTDLLSLFFSRPPDPAQRAAWGRAMTKATERRDRLNRELTAQANPWTDGQGRLQAKLADVQAALRKGEVLVDYVRYFGHYAVFVVQREGDPQRIELGSVKPIEAATERFHELAAKFADPLRPPSPELGRAGAKLHALIWKPLVEAVGDAGFVYVVPDGPLATVPFAALPGKEPGRVLYQDHPLGFLAHPQDLLPWLDAPPPGKGALGMGGVDYDRAATKTPEGLLEVPEPRRITLHEAMYKAPAGMQFTPLQGTLPEARACLTYFAEATKQDEIYLLHGPFATEDHLRRYAPGRRLLHLSTHGFVRLDLMEALEDGARMDPLLFTGLALAGCNRTEGGGSDDGVLTAHEAAQLNLDGVELVILSACETARGSTLAGEAVIGLTSAFREAGATSVVSSLWSVSDQASVMLMERFYRLVLVEGFPPPVALQKSALALRAFEVEHEGKKIRPFAAPCYWAAFVSYGPFR